MAKFYGKIGYAVTRETAPGVWTEEIEKRSYYIDILRHNRSLQNSGGVNDDLNISNQISIVADPYAYENFHNMRYVEFLDTKWKITNVEVQYPRLTMTLGGVYNGKQS